MDVCWPILLTDLPQAIKALQDKLSETRAAFEPRSKFTFKTKKNASAISIADAAHLAAEGRRIISGYRSPGASSAGSSTFQTPNPSTPLNEPDKQHQERPELAPTSLPPISLVEGGQKPQPEKKEGPSFAATSVSSVSVDDHYGLHIMLPASGSTSTVPASMTSLRHCVVDMSIPTADGKPYASLTIKGIDESLLICGQVNGPAHITGVEHSVLVVSCRQFRMHNCNDVDVYLSCSSNPIIEDCSNVRFGRIPRAYVSHINIPRRGLLLTHCSRPWTMIVPITKTAGVKLRTSSGSSRSPAPTGAFWIPVMQFQRRCGRRLSLAGPGGLSMIFCMLSSL